MLHSLVVGYDLLFSIPDTLVYGQVSLPGRDDWQVLFTAFIVIVSQVIVRRCSTLIALAESAVSDAFV